jgi:hypothetical protein
MSLFAKIVTRTGEDRIAYSMRALGRRDLPEVLPIEGKVYRHVETVKHDFFAATGFYEASPGDRVVLKMGRVQEFAGFPLEWLGARLVAREKRFYTKLADVANVPDLIGSYGPNGFIHRYIPGRQLEKGKPIPDGFFEELKQLMSAVHARGVAYVDANKPQNILLGIDGRPYLIDFQISWDLESLGDTFINRWWLSRLQREDHYHVLKHKRRMRPDELTPEELAMGKYRSPLIRLHRFIFRPYFLFRRTLFKRLRSTGRLLPDGSK